MTEKHEDKPDRPVAFRFRKDIVRRIDAHAVALQRKDPGGRKVTRTQAVLDLFRIAWGDK